MSDQVRFSMTKRRMAAFAICVLLGGLVLYAAGVVTGLLIGPGVPKGTAPPANAALAPPPVTKTPPQKTDASIPPPDGASRTPGLAVQVASFLDRGRAERFAASLKRQGFAQASVSEIASADQTWHVVRLGPYHDWDSASQVAAEIGRSYDLQCSVRPL